MRLRKTRIALLACTALSLLACPAVADSYGPEPRNNFGGVGLIDMPSARLAPDGEIGVGGSFLRNNQHYYFSFQALPWLETGFRYSGLGHNFGRAGFPVYYDRAIAVKARLWDETDLIPAVALGINDVVGTGVYAGEYLVASKQFGPFDATLGIGWGRLGSTAQFKNPFASIAPSFADRGSTAAFGGQLNSNTFFRGPSSGLFGGLVYHTPVDNLSLIAEYSSDAYVAEKIYGNLAPRNQLNFGASYKVGSASLGLAWLYGTTLSANIAFILDPVKDPFPQRLGSPPLPPAHLRNETEQQQALNQLLQQRQQGGTLKVSSRGLDDLSDTLFAQANIADVSVRGRTLVLGISQGNVRAICNNTAAMAARADVDIEAVVTTDAAGRSARCAVQRRSGSNLVNVTLTTNPHAGTPGALTTAALLTIDASAPAQPSTRSAIAAIKADAAKNQVVIQAISLTDSEAIVYYSNFRYAHEDDAVRRLVNVLMMDAPSNIEKFRLLPTSNDVPQTEFDVLRAPTERAIAQTGNYSLLSNGNEQTAAPMENPVLSETLRGTYPKFSWSIYPSFRQQLFDPNNPFAVQFLMAAQGVVSLRPGLSAVIEGELNLYDNFNVNRPSDSVLPHVRTDWARFFTEGKNGLGQLELTYLTRLAPDVFAQARVGYLENMYAGVGGEVLWRPQGQRWAIGGDVYHVKERAFDRLLGLQNYQVTTGHITLYYASPWYGMNFQLRAGQYLAGDRGLTFAISRTFSTGVELGVFMTKTNVSAAQFGEGSFDKGFTIKIPLGWIVPISTQSGINTVIRPVQRDGGQVLAGDANLYYYLQRSGMAEIFAHEEDTLNSGE